MKTPRFLFFSLVILLASVAAMGQDNRSVTVVASLACAGPPPMTGSASPVKLELADGTTRSYSLGCVACDRSDPGAACSSTASRHANLELENLPNVVGWAVTLIVNGRTCSSAGTTLPVHASCEVVSTMGGSPAPNAVEFVLR
jgi:hypothetical protein